MAYALNGSNGQGIVHPPVNDSAQEIADMKNYPHIRLYRASKSQPNESAAELLPARYAGDRSPVVGWSTPDDRVDFSNVCWFYGRNMYAALEAAGAARPIGLIGVYRGGSADELWSSPDALSECLEPGAPLPDPMDSTLYYGMIAPLLQTTIKGAVWYQGEADARHPGGRWDGYNCTFAAMIKDWRRKWSAGTNGETPVDFPFGWVQLNSVANGTVYVNPAAVAPNATTGAGGPLDPSFGYGGLRWAQTLTLRLPNTFMATCYDTPDRPTPQSIDGKPGADPGFSVHSPFKQPAGARLARAALALLKDEGVAVDIAFPVATSATRSGSKLIVNVENVAQGILPLRSQQGFEVLSDGIWVSVPPSATSKTTITLDLAAALPALKGTNGSGNGAATTLRYNWYSNPCGYYPFGCAVYVGVTPLGPLSGEEPFLPLPPFWLNVE